MLLPLRDHNPTTRTPVVTIALIAINTLVFLRQITMGPDMALFLTRWGATPYELTHFVDLIGLVPGIQIEHVEGPGFLPITALTSIFLHAGWLHLVLNMLFLWIFGNNVEDQLGRIRFLLFYLAAGLAGVALHVATQPESPVPMVGASGAISGMLGAYLVLFPRARVTSLLFLGFFVQLIQVPAVLLISLWMVIQVLGGLVGLTLSSNVGGVAYWAHIGGFVAGWVGMRVFFRKNLEDIRWRSRWRQLRGRYDDPWY